MQLAKILKERISSGEFRPGDRIPTASKLADMFDLSLMTVRQAITVLIEEGLVKSVHGSGTFVRKIEVGTTSFSLDSLNRILADRDSLKVSVLQTDIADVQEREREKLQIPADTRVILVKRLIFYCKKPFALQVAYTPFDPNTPVVEDMLDATGLSGFFVNDNPSGYKKGLLRLLPVNFSEDEAELLKITTGDQAFKLEYTYYNYENKPGAYGWFLIPAEKMALESRIGLWDE